MALQERRMHHLFMDMMRKKPCIGDRVRIMGFLGLFEVIQIRQNGLMVDLKHLNLPGPDYIEKEVLAKELIYLKPSQSAPRATLPSSRPFDGAGRAANSAVPNRAASGAR